MKNYIVMSLCAVILLLVADLASAKTFYLSDGAAIEYRQVWQQGGTIYLLVNRDTLLEFSPDEVDQRRSLKAAGLKRFPRPAVKERKAAPVVREKSAVRSAAAKDTDPVEEVVVVYAPAESAARPAAKGSRGRRSAPAQSGESGAQGLAAELVSVYENLHHAMKSRNVAAVKSYLSSGKVASLGDREIAMIEAGVSMMPPNRKVTGSSMSPDGNTATLSMTVRMDGSSKPGIGTITFVREDGAWKVDQENWEFEMN